MKKIFLFLLVGLFFVSCNDNGTQQKAVLSQVDMAEDSIKEEKDVQPEKKNNNTAEVNVKPASELSYNEINNLLDRFENMINQIEKLSISSAAYKAKKNQIDNLMEYIDDAELSENQEDRFDDLEDRYDDVIDDLEDNADKTKVDKKLNELERMINQLARLNTSSKAFETKADQIDDLIELIEDYDLTDDQEDKLDYLEDKFDDIAD